MRNITGKITKIDGTPASDVSIHFILVDKNGEAVASFDSVNGDKIIGKTTVITDENGDFTVSLWENDKLTDVTYYYVTVSMTGDTPFKAALLTGTGNISWLDFKLSGEPVTPNHLEVLQAYFDTIYQPIETSGTPTIGDILITYATPPTGYILVEDSGVNEVLYPALAEILPLGMIPETLTGISTEIYLGGLFYVISQDAIYVINTSVELVETIAIPPQYTGIDSLSISNGILYATTNSSAQVILSYSNGVWTDLGITALDYYHLLPYNNYIIAYGANNENNENVYEWNGTVWTQIVLPMAMGSVQNMQYGSNVLYAHDGGIIYYTLDKTTWTELIVPDRVNIPSFYVCESGELIISSPSANGLLYTRADIGSDWIEKSIAGEYYIAQIMAYNNKYFIVYRDTNRDMFLVFTTDFVSFDRIQGDNQIINYDNINDNIILYDLSTNKMTVIRTKPMATNIVPNQTYIYAGA